MQRAAAVVVGVALLAAAGQVSRLHTHAYVGHDHPEHHHGLAAHDHPQPVVHDDEDVEGPHVESCAPGGHEVTVAFGCAPATPRIVLQAEAAQMPTADRVVLLRIIRMTTETRAHGPPLLAPGPSRAPPHILPA